MKLTPEFNVEAFVWRGKPPTKQVVARHCEECGDRHDPEHAPHDGARYFDGEQWLCTACHQKKNGPLCGRAAQGGEIDDAGG